MKSVNSSQLERWIGVETLEGLSNQMRGWYGPPIGVHAIPGAVYVDKYGDFVGDLRAGWHTSIYDKMYDAWKKLRREASRQTMNAGFASFDAIIAAATSGKQRKFNWSKAIVSNGNWFAGYSWWRATGRPTIALNASAAPGGDVLTSASLGAIPFDNPTGGEGQYIVSGVTQELGVPLFNTSLLLYDRLYQVPRAAATGTSAVTGVPTRYQSTVSSNPDYIGGNFLFIEGETTIGVGARTHDAVYTNQAGTAGKNMLTISGVNNGITMPQNYVDHAPPFPRWFAPLASGDVGVKQLTQVQITNAGTNGNFNIVIGHPLVWMPLIASRCAMLCNNISSAFNLTRIFDNAALSVISYIDAIDGTHNLELTTVYG